MTLVAPLWPEKAWFADLLLLLTQPPLALPLWDRLLRQPHFHRFHGGVHALNLHAWRLLRKSGFSRDGACEVSDCVRESTTRLNQLLANRLSGKPLSTPSPLARETRGIAPSLLFKKNYAVSQVLKAGTWRCHTTFTRHYL